MAKKHSEPGFRESGGSPRERYPHRRCVGCGYSPIARGKACPNCGRNPLGDKQDAPTDSLPPRVRQGEGKIT